MKIVLNTIPPTINKYIGKTNSCWMYEKDKKEYTKAVVLQTIGINPKIKACEMVITFYHKDNIRRDSHNYSKQLLDALVEANIIVDDNDKVIQKLTIIGKIDKRKPRIEIDIEEISGMV